MIFAQSSKKFWFRVGVTCAWLVLFVMLLQRDYFITTISVNEQQTIAKAKTEEYQAIYFRDKKIGYVASTTTPLADNLLGIEQTGIMHLNVAGTSQTIELKLNATTTSNNVLQQFTFSFQSPFYRMDGIGESHEHSVTYRLQTTSSTIEDTVVFPAAPMLPTSNRAYLLKEDIEVGEKRKIPWFDPVSMTGKNSVIEYRGRESQLIGGRVMKLHKFIESFGGTRVNFWLNDRGSVVKEESPAGFVFIREPKFRALAMQEQSEELLSAVSIQTSGILATEDATIARYRLTIPEGSELDLDSDRQSFADSILTVTREIIPSKTGAPTCSGAETALQATPYIQSQAKQITTLASEIIANTKAPADKLRAIANWVFNNLHKQSVIGLPDALTTLNTRQGDCNEHASLFAALARAAGIPARILAGVTANNSSFYYHAWNEVCLGSSWISIDTTTNQLPVDLTHLQFVRGELEEQIRLTSLLGKLRIEPLLSAEK